MPTPFDKPPEFTPFLPPETDYAPFNTGIGAEHGTTPKALVDGLNLYLDYLFKAGGPTPIRELEEAVTSLQMRLDALEHPHKAKGR